MNIKEIVGTWLAANGYDGLYNPGECGCTLGEDFMACDEPNIGECKAGHKLAACKKCGCGGSVGEKGSTYCPWCDDDPEDDG